MTAVPVSPADRLREAADVGLIELPTDLAIPLSELLRALADQHDYEQRTHTEGLIHGFDQAVALAEVILTGTRPSGPLVDRLAGAVTWHLQPLADDEMGRHRIDDPEERAAYDAAYGFREGSDAVQAIRRRKVAEAMLAVLGEAEG